jgi:hypothetical protein
MANRRISIFDSFLSGGSVGSSLRRSLKETLNASTRIRSRVACAVRYFCVARRRRRRSSRVNDDDSLRQKQQQIVHLKSAVLCGSIASSSASGTSNMDYMCLQINLQCGCLNCEICIFMIAS